MVSFSQLPSVKEDTIFGAARKFFGPSYFVTALVTNPIIDLSYKCLACEPFLFVIEHLFTSKFESRYLYSWNPQSALNYLTCFCLDLMTIFHSFFSEQKGKVGRHSERKWKCDSPCQPLSFDWGQGEAHSSHNGYKVKSI